MVREFLREQAMNILKRRNGKLDECDGTVGEICLRSKKFSSLRIYKINMNPKVKLSRDHPPTTLPLRIICEKRK